MASEEFACPHCGSHYSRMVVTMNAPDCDVETCVVCEEVMEYWDSRQVPVFHLVKPAALQPLTA